MNGWGQLGLYFLDSTICAWLTLAELPKIGYDHLKLHETRLKIAHGRCETSKADWTCPRSS